LEIEPTPSYISFWEVTSELMTDRLRDARPENRDNSKPEKEPLEVFEYYCTMLKKHKLEM